jgi:hypothetical protein
MNPAPRAYSTGLLTLSKRCQRLHLQLATLALMTSGYSNLRHWYWLRLRRIELGLLQAGQLLRWYA